MTIHLEISPHEVTDISYFSLGNFIFEKDGVYFTSKNRKPDQSCMLLASLPNLFDRLVKVKRGETRKFVFKPLDCSYELLFEKQKDQLVISEFSRQKLICGIDEFAEAFYREVNDLMVRYYFRIEELDIAREDFVESFKSFIETFDLEK